MKDGLVRVEALTPAVSVASPLGNAAVLIDAARASVKNGARVLVFPELALSTSALGDLFLQASLLTACEEALTRFIAATADLDAISFVGTPVRVCGKVYDCCAVVAAGQLLGIVPKTYLTAAEARTFAPASPTLREVSYAGFRVPFGTDLLFTCTALPALSIAVEFGSELDTVIPPSSLHAAAGATVIVSPAALPALVGSDETLRREVEVQSRRTATAYILANAGSGESGTDMVFSGHSIIASLGHTLRAATPFAAEDTACEIDVERILFARARKTTLSSDGDPAYTEIPFSLSLTETQITLPPARLPFVPTDRETLARRCDLILEMQSRALAARMQRAHAEHLVLGISGGLDSTLALLVSVRALDLIGKPRTAVTAVTMPCFGTTARTRSNAERLSDSLGATLRVVDIKEAVDVHFRDIGHDPENLSVVYENAQARERTQVLMDIANGQNGLVVGTGDLSELALGWATYNGDHMSMYGVNAGIPKTLMRHIVAHEADRLGEVAPTASACLRDILATPVSPELLPPQDGEIAQCTEGIVGPYELHDFFLFHLVRHGDTPRKILRLATAAFAGEYDRETIKRWLTIFVRRFFTQQFKRSCLPDGPMIGSVTLSPRGGWVAPSDASYDAWMGALE